MSNTTEFRAGRRVIWPKELCERWGISLVTLWRWRRARKMPQPDFQGSGWQVQTIERFERGQIAEEH